MADYQPIPAGFPSFADLDPVTAVFDVSIEQRINTQALFCLASRAPGPYPDTQRRGLASALPLPPNGSIISLKFDRAIRGDPAKVGWMKNMVIIRLVVDDKLVTVNAGGTTLHICGTKSEAQTLRIVEVLLQTLYPVQQDVQHLLDHYEQWSSWLVERLDGLPAELAASEDFIEVPAKTDLAWLTAERIEAWVTSAPDQAVARFFLGLAADYSPQSLWTLFTQLPTMGNIMTGGEPQINDIQCRMVRYNYRLGFQIDKKRLHQVIFEIDTDFEADHDATLTRYVNITCPEIGVDREGKVVVRHHTFNVDWHGVVHQFSPSIETAERAYAAFWDMILLFRRSLILPGRS